MQTSKYNRPLNNVTFDRENEKYFMEIALPGVGKEDISIETEENLLIISTKEKGDAKTPFIDYSGKTWRYRLPERTDVDAMVASVENGILSIEIPLKVIRRSIKVA